MSAPFELRMFTPEAELFNKRVFQYLKELSEFIDPSLKTPLKHEFNAYYAGGTLCLDIPFWKAYPKGSNTGKMEVILLNLDGSANSTIYGGFVMDLINLELVREIYVYSKGETDYYKSNVDKVL